MRILLCSDHGLLADALRAELRQQGHDVVVATSVPQVLRHVVPREIDVCLLHLRSPSDVAAAEAVASVREASPRTTVVLLTDNADAVVSRAATRAGAAQVLTTSIGLTALLEALCTRSRPVPKVALNRPVAVTGPGSLTARESEVFLLISRGASTTEAADALNVAPSTVRGHAQRVLEKLGVHSRLQAAAIATAEGLVLIGSSAMATPLSMRDRGRPGLPSRPVVPAMRMPLPAERW